MKQNYLTYNYSVTCKILCRTADFIVTPEKCSEVTLYQKIKDFHQHEAYKCSTIVMSGSLCNLYII